MIDSNSFRGDYDWTALTPVALKLTGFALLKETTVINGTSQSFRSMQQIIGVVTHPILLPFQHVYAPDTTLFLAKVFICLYFFHFRITGKINSFGKRICTE